MSALPVTRTISTVVPPTTATPAALSVVLVTPDSFATIRTTVRHLCAQTARERVELVVVAPALAGVRIPASEVHGLHGCRLVEIAPWTTISVAKAHALHAATAPLVAFAEDHSFPEPGWAAALIAAHARGYVGVGVAMCNANPDHMVSWAGLFMNFGGAVELTQAGEARDTSASHNTSYDRAALLALGDELPRLMQAELFLQDALRARGHRLWREPAARTRHVQITRLRPWLGAGFAGGRLYGALCAELGGWSLGRRVLYAGGAPLVPAVRLRRVMRDIRATTLARTLLPPILPALIVGLLVHAAGELTGYLAGLGDTETRYSDFEMRRWDNVGEQDHRAWG